MTAIYESVLVGRYIDGGFREFPVCLREMVLHVHREKISWRSRVITVERELAIDKTIPILPSGGLDSLETSSIALMHHFKADP